MNALPKLGKIPPEFFNRVIYPKLGKNNPDVLVKPQHGVDFGVIDLGSKVLVLSTDPFYIAAELGIEKAAWFAVHILASDVAVSGISPQYLSVDLNLPPQMSEKELIRMWNVVDSECKKLGINVVTGHTARYAGCNYPMVGGATVFGIDSKEKLIIPRAEIGDLIIVSKGAAIETTALMAAYFPKFIEKKYGKTLLKKAQAVYYSMSVVKDALVCASVGGVHAMHDATECGILGGLYEMAAHSKVGMRIDLDKVILPEEVRLTCACFGIDPYCAISEGTLLAIASRSKAKNIVRSLDKAGIASSIVGEIVSEKEGIHIFKNKRKSKLKHPRVDPFWVKFEEYLKK